MSVELTPSSQLGFPRPLTQLVKRSLSIHNPNPHPIAFKVKTTAPKQYCVRPNSGRVEAGETVEVHVLLQPLTAEPPPHAKCKDKFLVQSAFISPDEEMKTLHDMWAQTEKTNKSAIKEQKVKCVYLPAEDGSTGQDGIPEENEDSAMANGDHSRMMDESQVFAAAEQSPSSPHVNGNGNMAASPVVAGAGLAALGGAAAGSSKSDKAASTSSKGINEPPLPPLTAKDINQPNAVSPTNAAMEASLQSTAPEGDKLNAALKEIDRLKAQLSEAQGPQVTGLRKRGGASSNASGAEVMTEKAKEVASGSSGVPIEIVGGLMLGVFILTYLFF